MGHRYDDILGTVGRTPVVRINKLAPAHVNLYVKAEAFNPMGSVKDRLAIGVIEAAERDGSLKPGQTVIEATSGNTGIGLAMVCAVKGYPLVVTMAESFSIERRKLMRFLGAKVVLTPADQKGMGMLKKAIELAEAHGWFLTRQFDNPANADIHSRTTAPEILEDFADVGLDYWVTGAGTAGTLKGVARVLKEKSPKTRVIVCEPDNAPILGSGVAQPRGPKGEILESHPYWRPHLMQGWTPDWIPQLAEDALDAGWIDDVEPINGDDAMNCCRDLAQKEGIFVGVSGGATFAGALAVARKAHEGANILAMLPDTGERYLSTPLFADVPEHMTAEEKAISDSTPTARFGVASAPAPKPAEPEAPHAAEPEAVAFLEAAVNDPEQPVVVFALEWCEFCWSVRRMFKELGVAYRSVDLDSAAYQDGNWGGRIRIALRDRTGKPTIPQIFVGGTHIGGATETFDAFNSGALQKMLAANGVAYDQALKVNAYSFLPKWLHPR